VETRTALADLVSPMSAFVRECCERGPDVDEAPISAVYDRWKLWAEDTGQQKMSVQTFGRNLRAVIPGLRVAQPRIGPKNSQVRVWAGLGLKK